MQCLNRQSDIDKLPNIYLSILEDIYPLLKTTEEGEFYFL